MNMRWPVRNNYKEFYTHTLYYTLKILVIFKNIICRCETKYIKFLILLKLFVFLLTSLCEEIKNYDKYNSTNTVCI